MHRVIALRPALLCRRVEKIYELLIVLHLSPCFDILVRNLLLETNFSHAGHAEAQNAGQLSVSVQSGSSPMEWVCAFRVVNLLVLAAFLAGCGGSGGDSGGGTAPPLTFTVGGTLAGLASGAGVVLQNNAGSTISLSANGAFTFATAVSSGAHQCGDGTDQTDEPGTDMRRYEPGAAQHQPTLPTLQSIA